GAVAARERVHRDRSAASERLVSVLRDFTSGAIARLKGDPGYRVAGDLTDRQLATVLWHRMWQVLRGTLFRMTTHGVRGTVFRGRRVVVEHTHQFQCESNLILED